MSKSDVHIFRVHPGQDLKEAILKEASKNFITAG
jgi:hypothetical protein